MARFHRESPSALVVLLVVTTNFASNPCRAHQRHSPVSVAGSPSRSPSSVRLFDCDASCDEGERSVP